MDITNNVLEARNMAQINTEKHSTFPKCPTCNGWKTIKVDVEGYELPIEYLCPTCNGSGFSRTTKCRGEYDIEDFRFDYYPNENFRKQMVALSKSFIENYLKFERNPYVEGLNSHKTMGIYIWGSTGVGKSFFAHCLEGSVKSKYHIHTEFVSAPKYISYVYESYSREKGAVDPSEKFRKCRLLVLDDIGAQRESEQAYQELHTLIEDRTNNGLVTIYTSNFPISKLNLDDKLKSKLAENVQEIKFPDVSIRDDLSKKNKASFFRDAVNGNL